MTRKRHSPVLRNNFTPRSFRTIFTLYTNQNEILSLPFTGTINKIRRKAVSEQPANIFPIVSSLVRAFFFLFFFHFSPLFLCFFFQLSQTTARHEVKCKRQRSYSYTCNIFVSTTSRSALCRLHRLQI